MLATFCAIFKRPFSFGHWLSLFTLGNSLLMTAITLGLGDWAGLLMSGIYLPLAMLIHLTFITSLISLGIFAIVKLGKLSRSGYWLSALVFSLALILVVTNFKVYELYHFHLNGVVLNFIFSGALMENLAFSWVMWVNLALILIAVLGVQTLLCLAAALLASKVYGRRFTKSAIAICISLILGLQLLNGFADAMAWRNILAQNRFIPWMPSVTMRKSLRNLGLPVVDSKSQDLQVKAGALNYPLQPLSCNTVNPPNILMLVVDSLRFDMLTPEIMPETSRFAARAIRFDNHYSTGNATRNGMFGLMYGLNASYWQAMLRQEQGSILFDLTLAQDYQHFIYGSTKLTFPEFDRTIFSRLREQLVKGSHKSSADNDREITQRLINDLENADKQRPFFGFAFYDAPHAYSLPKDFNSPFQPMLDQVDYLKLNNTYDPAPYRNRYKTTAFYDDQLIGQLLSKVEALGLLSNTIVIITSDHGQEFNETGKNYWGHNGNFTKWQTKVPMVIYWPNKTPDKIEHISSHEDLIPTLVQDAFNCSNPIANYSTGENLFHPTEINRNLLMESWNDRAVRYEDAIYLIDTLGNSSAVDDSYEPLNEKSLPARVIQDNLEKMSRFMKH